MELFKSMLKQNTATKLLALAVVMLTAVVLLPSGSNPIKAQTGDLHVLTCDEQGNIPITAVKYFIGAEVTVSLSGGSASVYNGTNCNLPVSLATYEMYDRTLGNQKLFDATAVVNVGPGQNKILNVSLPACMAQTDLYYGEPLLQLDNANSGSYKTLAWSFHMNNGSSLEDAYGNFCGQTYEPKLEISKRGPASVSKGDTMRYEIMVSNIGNTVANNVVVTDLVPSGLEYVGSMGASCTASTSSVVCTLGDILVNNNKYIELEFKVLDIAPCGNITNKATAKATGTSEVNAESYTNVECVTPTLVCTPANQSVGINVLASFSASGGNGGYAWSANGGNPISGSGASFNTKYVTSGSKTVTVTSGSKSASCKVEVEEQKECKLEISKTANKAEAKVGEEVTYTINFKNTGTKNCTGGGVKVADVLDTHLQFVKETHSSNVTAGYGSLPAYDTGSRTVYWNADVLTPGESGQVSFTAKVVNIPACTEKNIPNRAGITSSEYNNFATWVYSNTVNIKAKADCTVPELICAPASQTVKLSQTASFVATGGSGTYAWTAVGGTPASGIGSNYTTKYTTAGSKQVKVTSGDKQATCTVTVEDYPTLVCSPANQSVKLEQTAGFVATGGSGTYAWTAVGGTPVSGTGATFSSKYYSVGTKLVSVTSGDKTANCNVTITEQPQDLVCAPSSQTVNVNQLASFVASGGNGTYAWTAVGGTPVSGTGATFSSKYASSGNKTVKVTSGSKTANCNVQVKDVSLVCSPDLQYTDINQTVTIVGSGGDGNYNWYAPEASTGNASGSQITIAYPTSGTKNVTLYSAGKSDTCQVVVRQLVNTSLSIQKQVRNLTLGGGFQDNLTGVRKGDTLEYQVRIRNTGNTSATGVMLKDVVSQAGYLENFRNMSSTMLFSGVLQNGVSFNSALPAGQEIVVSYLYTAGQNFSNIQVCNIAQAWANQINQLTDTSCVSGSGGQPSLVLSKKAYNDTLSVDAQSRSARLEDYITYTLTVRNNGTADALNFVVEDDLSGVLPLADMVDLGGGVLAGNTIRYASVTVPAQGSITKSFKVRVKYHLSSSISYQMLNTYGNTITIVINPPKPYVPPKTGGLVDLLAGMGFAGALTAGYAWKRRKNLSLVK